MKWFWRFIDRRKSNGINTSGQHRRITDDLFDTIKTNREELDRLAS